MIKNFYYRFLLVITIVTGCLFVSSVPEASNPINWMIFAATFFFLCGITFDSFKRLSQERINEILFVDWFKNHGINIDED